MPTKVPKPEQPLVTSTQREGLAHVYLDFDRAFNRTQSRAAVDGGVMLLGIWDEIRALRHAIEARGEKKAS